jgi:hypothetical protein
MTKALFYFALLLVAATAALGNEFSPAAAPQSVTQIPPAWIRYAIEGYAYPSSVSAGEGLKFYVSICDSGAQHSNYRIRIFRLPDTANALYVSPIITGRFYPLHDSVGASIGLGDYSRKAVDFRRGCTQYWESTAVQFFIPSSWRSGLYYAQLEHQSSSVVQNQYYAPFIVRAPTNAPTSAILFKYDFLTNQAYNYWGGGSLYSKSQDTLLTVSDSIAIDRPMWYDLSKTIKYGYANQFIKALEDSGMVMDYCNNIDVDSLGLPFLSAYKTMVLWQHDEYWSQTERHETESFVGRNNSGQHGNLARFSANTCYWRIEWLNRMHMQLRCNKWWVGSSYPQAGRFRNVNPTQPEGKFLGSQYERGFNTEDTEMPSDSVVAPDHWIFRGLGLKYGDTLGYGYTKNGRWIGMLGTELDNSRQLNGKAEFPTTILAKRYVRSYKDKTNTEPLLHEMIYYEDTLSNARVFGLGTGSLSAVLYPCKGNDRAKVLQMIVNIMSHFSEKKYIGSVYTSPASPLLWESDIRLDGDVRVLPGKKLVIEGSLTVTIDSTLIVEGELEVGGNVTIAGAGSVRIQPGGTLRIKSGTNFFVRPEGLVLDEQAVMIHSATVKPPSADFGMSQNYPNPFNPSTNIPYRLPSSSRVSLTVFNLLGQKVADLIEADQEAGWHEANWQADVPSGTYFYRIVAVSKSDPSQRFTMLKKMIFLK